MKNHTNLLKKYIKWASIPACTLLLTACGGGGGSKPTPPSKFTATFSPNVMSLQASSTTQKTAHKIASSNQLSVMTSGSSGKTLNITLMDDAQAGKAQYFKIQDCQTTGATSVCDISDTDPTTEQVKLKVLVSDGTQSTQATPTDSSATSSDIIINSTAPTPPPPPVAGPHVIHVTNTTPAAIHSTVQLSLKSSDGSTQTLADTASLQPNTSKDYSVCASWYDAITKKPELELSKNATCSGTSPNGSTVIEIPKYWTGPSILSVDVTTNNTSFSSDQTTLTFSQNNISFTSFKKENVLNITMPAKLITDTLQLDSALQASKHISYHFTNTDVTADKSLTTIQFATGSNPTISAEYDDAPFKQVLFDGADGSSQSAYTMKTSGAVSATLASETLNQFQPKGWPNYVASGAVDDFGTNTTLGITQRKTADAIFKYAGNDGGGDNGADAYNLFYTKAKAVIRTVAAAQTFSKQFGYPVRPIAVVYTTNASGGDQKEAEAQVSQLDLLEKHLDFLAITALYLEKNPVATGVYGSIVLNPDTYGEGHKDNYYQDTVSPTHSGLTNMVHYLQGYNLITSSQAATMQTSINQLFATDTGSFKTYNQALNWIMHTLGPDVTYGMADNVWAGDASGHAWLHNSTMQTITQHATSEANYLIDNGVYGNSNDIGNPSFIAFDKYERNTFVKSNKPLGVYFYNNNDWGTYINYVSETANQIAAAEHAPNNILPIMLFQIPGGHIPATDENNWQYGATGPDYFLGDQKVCNGTDNQGATESLNNPLTSDFGQTNVTTYQTYLKYMMAPEHFNSYNQTANLANHCLMGGHTADLITNHIFAILWGGGSTTSIAGPQDDGGYLASLIQGAKHYNFAGQVIPSPYKTPVKNH